MPIETKIVETKLTGRTIKHYENLGYLIPRIMSRGKLIFIPGSIISVNVKDLPQGSEIKVTLKCDICGGIVKDIEYYRLPNSVKTGGEYCCGQCSRNGGKKWVSFHDWCYTNLKEIADAVLARWDYELNVDKNGDPLGPKDVSFSSNGPGKKGFWFKCLDHPEHGSERKSIASFTILDNAVRGNLKCIQCSKVGVTHPYAIVWFVNRKDAFNHPSGSHAYVPVKCPTCEHNKQMQVKELIGSGVTCPNCSKGYYPEKFVFSLLVQLGLTFITQLSSSTFPWVEEYKYDLYIACLNCIIETHGGQHYEEARNRPLLLRQVQDNDNAKESLARENEITNYVIINCHYSRTDWIKNSIMKRDLSRPDQPCLAEVLGFNEDRIDWQECHVFAITARIKPACNLWTGGLKDLSAIGLKLKQDPKTIREYLKLGADIGLCDYDPILATAKCHNNFIKSNCKPVRCSTGEEFESAKAAGEWIGQDPEGIGACCRGRIKHSGNHPDKGVRLSWGFVTVDMFVSGQMTFKFG